MPWQWLLQVWQQDPLAIGQAAFIWLAAVALGISWYASRIPPRIPPDDLDQLHRQIDDVRQRIRRARNDGHPNDRLQQTLDGLREQLPRGDARRW